VGVGAKQNRPQKTCHGIFSQTMCSCLPRACLFQQRGCCSWCCDNESDDDSSHRDDVIIIVDETSELPRPRRGFGVMFSRLTRRHNRTTTQERIPSGETAQPPLRRNPYGNPPSYGSNISRSSRSASDPSEPRREGATSSPPPSPLYFSRRDSPVQQHDLNMSSSEPDRRARRAVDTQYNLLRNSLPPPAILQSSDSLATNCSESPWGHNATNKSGPLRAIQNFFRQIQEAFQDEVSTTISHWAPHTNEEESRRLTAADDFVRLNSSDMNPGEADPDTPSKPKSLVSPLQAASTFDASSSDVFTIARDEVVMPGSPLQLRMSQAMRLNFQINQSLLVPNREEGQTSSEGNDDEIVAQVLRGAECVICLEPFDDSNPRIPTVCGCGTNKTYFHLPCLYQWVEKCPDCPTCREPMEWEEL
jgi:Ring finger domain